MAGNIRCYYKCGLSPYNIHGLRMFRFPTKILRLVKDGYYTLVVFCNIVCIQCSPYHLLALDDDDGEDEFNDVNHFDHNLPLEGFLDDTVDDLRNPVALRSSGIGGIIAGLGQMANGVVDVLGKGALSIIGTGRDPPTIVIHQPQPPPIVVPPYNIIPNQVPIPVPVPCCS